MSKHNRPQKTSFSPALRAKRLTALKSAKSMIAQNRFEEAEAILRRDIPKSSRDPDALRLRSLIAERQNRPEDAMDLARKSARIASHPDTHLLLAQIHARHGDTLATINSCRDALAMAPENINARIMLAAALEERNLVDDAAEELAPILKSPPESIALRRRSSRIHAAIEIRRNNYEEAVEILDTQVISNDAPPPEQRGALFLRAKALDQAGKFDEAFKSAQRANDLGRVHFDPVQYEQQLAAFMGTWNREMIDSLPLGDPKSELPVFIAGMPRSGTSLLDRIIDAHPQGSGVGELSLIEQFWSSIHSSFDSTVPADQGYAQTPPAKWKETARGYLSRIMKLAPPGTKRIANKSISNDLMLGLITRLFPQTRIIHIVRDPRDVAVSCFFGGFNTQIYPWTTRLEWISKAWKVSQDIMEHWSVVLDTPIHTIGYEELVQDPETQLPKMIEFLGLEWDQACTRFYELDRPIRTLSYDQVNQPINTSSVGRHQNYAQYIDKINWPI